MNSSQVSILKKFGEHLVYIDSTHESNGYDFSLITLMVIEKFGEEFPIARLKIHYEIENALTRASYR